MFFCNLGLKNSCKGWGFETTTLDLSFQSGALDYSAMATPLALCQKVTSKKQGIKLP